MILNVFKKIETYVCIGILFAVSASWYYGGIYVDKVTEENFITKSKIQNNRSSDALSENEIWQMRGVYGDKFGAVNALFSAFAFAGIIFALILQRNDLSLQRASIDQQTESARLQNFENSFFSLLNTYSSIVEQLVSRNDDRGRIVFSEFIASMKAKSTYLALFAALRKLTKDEVFEIRASQTINDTASKKLLREDIANIQVAITAKDGSIDKYLDADLVMHLEYLNSGYNLAHTETGGALSHYFRNLYVLLKFIDSAEHLDEEQKKNYSRIVRAQLSEDELVCLAYNCIATPDGIHATHTFGKPKMSALCKRFNIFKHINHSALLHEKHTELLNKECI